MEATRSPGPTVVPTTARRAQVAPSTATRTVEGRRWLGGDPGDPDRGDRQQHQDRQGGEADPDGDEHRPDAADGVP